MQMKPVNHAAAPAWPPTLEGYGLPELAQRRTKPVSRQPLANEQAQPSGEATRELQEVAHAGCIAGVDAPCQLDDALGFSGFDPSGQAVANLDEVLGLA